jgi:hypothetical protein
LRIRLHPPPPLIPHHYEPILVLLTFRLQNPYLFPKPRKVVEVRNLHGGVEGGELVEELGELDSTGDVVGFAGTLDEDDEFLVHCTFAGDDGICRELFVEEIEGCMDVEEFAFDSMNDVNLYALNDENEIVYALFLPRLFITEWHPHRQLLDERPWKPGVLLPSLSEQNFIKRRTL